MFLLNFNYFCSYYSTLNHNKKRLKYISISKCVFSHILIAAKNVKMGSPIVSILFLFFLFSKCAYSFPFYIFSFFYLFKFFMKFRNFWKYVLSLRRCRQSGQAVGKPTDLVRLELTTMPFAGICSTTYSLIINTALALPWKIHISVGVVVGGRQHTSGTSWITRSWQ